MAEYGATGYPPQGAESVGMKRPREDGFDGVAEGGGQQQGGEPWPGYPGEHVYRLIVPVNRVGVIIGRKGAWIKNLCQETNAQVKVMEAVPGTEERGVIISAKENYNMELPPSVIALLKVHDRAVLGGQDEDDLQGRQPPPPPDTATAKLLIPQVQAGTIIGKGGQTIKAMQEQTQASIKVLQEQEFLRSDAGQYALPDDRMVEISGPVAAVQTALRVAALQLRKYLVDRGAVPYLEHPERSRPAAAPVQAASYGGVNSGYGNGAGAYGQAAYGQAPAGYAQPVAGQWPAQAYGGQADPYAAAGQMVEKVTVPNSYMESLIGQGGARLAQIRQSSGASVTVQATADGANFAVEIRGSQQQVSAAHSLVQSYLGAATTAPAAGGYDQGGYYSAPAGGGYAQPQAGGAYAQPQAGGYDQTQAQSYTAQYSTPQAPQYSQYSQY